MNLRGKLVLSVSRGVLGPTIHSRCRGVGRQDRRGLERGPGAEPGPLWPECGACPVPVDQPGRGREGRRVVRAGEAVGVESAGGTAFGQPPELDRNTGDEQPRQGMEQPGDAAPARGVAGNRQVRPIAQDQPDKRGQGRTGPDLQEDPGAGGVHRLDHRGEPDRLGEVLAELRRDRRGIGGIRSGVNVRIDRKAGACGTSPSRSARRGQWPARRGDQRRVERAGDR